MFVMILIVTTQFGGNFISYVTAPYESEADCLAETSIKSEVVEASVAKYSPISITPHCITQADFDRDFGAFE